MHAITSAKCANSDGLTETLSSSQVSHATKEQIAETFWNNKQAETPSLASRTLEPYFRFYTAQSDLALHDLGRHAVVRTHQDVINIVRHFQQGLEREQIRDILKAVPVSSKLENHEVAIETSIDLAARLLLMTRVGCIHRGFSGRKDPVWKHGSLQQFVARLYEPSGFSAERVKLDKIFVAKNLLRIARIGIIWTDNLADHLRMFEHDTRVAIFHHASFLKLANHSDVFPSGLIEETLRSIALLFPQTDKATRKWYRREALAHGLDICAIDSGYLKAEDRCVDHFRFWRDRIIILKQIFDETEPTSWSQWLHDRRRGLHRYPVLIAALGLTLTAFFGMVQCIEGGLQVWKAYHPG